MPGEQRKVCECRLPSQAPHRPEVALHAGERGFEALGEVKAFGDVLVGRELDARALAAAKHHARRLDRRFAAPVAREKGTVDPDDLVGADIAQRRDHRGPIWRVGMPEPWMEAQA